MTATVQESRTGNDTEDRSTSFVEGGGPGKSEDAVTAASRRTERLRLLVQPVLVILTAGGVLFWAFAIHQRTETEKATLNFTEITNELRDHVLITVTVTAIVLVIAIPLGVLLTRPGPVTKFLSPVIIGIANIGAAAPAVGLLVLFYLVVGETKFYVGVLPIAFYALLPVLRNTILGFQEVPATLIDAGKGQGMSAWGILSRIEFPLAVPYILAGLRTTLVLAVGTATLSFLVSGLGLGVLIQTGYTLSRTPVLVVGAVLAVALALLVDWLGALAEQYLGPKGLR